MTKNHTWITSKRSSTYIVLSQINVNCFGYIVTIVTRLGDWLDFGQLFKAFVNNIFAKISYLLRQFCKGVKICHKLFKTIVHCLLFQSHSGKIVKKIGPNPASFCLFSFFSHDIYSTNLTINDENIDGVLGTWTWGSRIVGADKSTELWLKPLKIV